jgi:hypothetical protein
MLAVTTAASNVMMAITTTNSINVKPRRRYGAVATPSRNLHREVLSIMVIAPR